MICRSLSKHCVILTIVFLIFGLECCETIILSSTNPSFTSNQAFGIGTYKKVGTDSRDRIMYRNSDYTFGDFILFYEGPNEGGRQNWLVGTHKLSINLALNQLLKFAEILFIAIFDNSHLIGVPRVLSARS